MKETVDIFKDLSHMIGCDDISDLRFEPYLEQAKEYITHIDLNCYPVTQIADLYHYLGMSTELDELVKQYGFLQKE